MDIETIRGMFQRAWDTSPVQERQRALALIRAVEQVCQSGWTSACHAQDRRGLMVQAESAKAVCFSLLGAFWRARLRERNPQARQLAILALYLAAGTDDLHAWSRDKVQRQALETIDLARQVCETARHDEEYDKYRSLLWKLVSERRI